MRGQPPAFAQAYGITPTLVSDDFNSTATIDTTNSLQPGFNWYLNNDACRQGSCATVQPSPSSYYSASNSVLNFNNRPFNEGSIQFSSVGLANTSPGGTTAVMMGDIPLINGARPFYVEWNAQFTNQSEQSLWMEDLSALERNMNNTGNSATLAELGVVEIHTPPTGNQHIITWTSPTSDTVRLNTVTAWTQTQYNTWGILVVPRAYNGGTGFAQPYLNGVLHRAALTWSGADTYGIEASQYLMMFAAGNNPAAPLNVDYIGAWVHA